MGLKPSCLANDVASEAEDRAIVMNLPYRYVSVLIE